MVRIRTTIAVIAMAALAGCQTPPASDAPHSDVIQAGLPTAAYPDDNANAALMPPDPERIRLKEMVSQLESELDASGSQVQELTSENKVLNLERQRLEERVTSLQSLVQQGQQELVDSEARTRKAQAETVEAEKQALVWQAAAEELQQRNLAMERDHEQELGELLGTLNGMIRQFEESSEPESTPTSVKAATVESAE